MRGPWEFESPACAEVGLEWFYPETPEGMQSGVYEPLLKTICGGCPHLRECGDWAIRHEYYGYWGGMTVRDRIRIRSQRGITGWEISA